MIPDFESKPDPVRWPILAALAAGLFAYRRRILARQISRAMFGAVAVQMAVLPALAWCSARQSHQFPWIAAMLASHLIFLWPVAVAVFAFHQRRFRMGTLADQLDRLNPGKPDPFRTLLSLGNHRSETLDELNRYYKGLESSLKFPALSWFGLQRLGFYAASLAVGLTLLLFSGDYQAAASRAAFPLSAWRNRPTPRLEPVNLQMRWALGDTLRATVRIQKLPHNQPVYALVIADEERRYVLNRLGDSAGFQLGPLTGDIRLRFSAPGVKTGEYRIRVVPPPGLRSLSAEIRPPPYTRLAPEFLTEFPPAITALPGSSVHWIAKTHEKMRSMRVIFQQAGKAHPETLELGGGKEFSFHRKLHGALDFQMLLTDEDGLKGRAGPFHLDPGVDAPPEITLITPSGDKTLGRALKMPVAFRVRDDFGVSSVRLRYSVFTDVGLKSDGYKDLKPWIQPGASGMGGGLWDLEGLDLYPGNQVELFLEAADNDAVSGPKRSRSAVVRLRMPSLEEVMGEVETEEKAAEISLRSAAERAERMSRETEKAASPQRSESAPPPAGWELQRIFSAAPRQHMQRLRRHLEAEAGASGKESALGRQLESLRKATAEMEKRIPAPDVERAPLEEQDRQLETLMKDQQDLDKSLSELKPTSSPSESLAQERKRLQDELQRNRAEQKELQAWLQDRLHEKGEMNRMAEQAAKAEERVREDMQQAIEQMQKALEKGMENGTLSPDLLEKMERIRELLREVMPDSMRQRLEQEAQSQKLGADEIRKNLEELLEKREGLREGLDRAIRMLELMREMRDLKNMAQALRTMEREEMELSHKMREGGQGGEMLESQANLRKRLEETRTRLERMAQEQKEFRDLKNEPNAAAAAAAMREVEEGLRGNSKAGPAAAKKAESASRSLGRSAEAMESLLAGLEGGPDPSEIIAALEETLDYSRWLEAMRNGEGAREGWEDGQGQLEQRASQIARWLRVRLSQLATAQPYEGEALSRAASALGYHAEAPSSPARLDSLGLHARKAARELLKTLADAQSEPSGDGQGMGSQAGGKGNGKGRGRGKGKGQGEGDEPDGMAGRIRGLSGRQMAVNQATQQLLQSFLEGRRPGQGNASEGGGGESGGKEGGSSGEGGNAANEQQGVGESLESLAEGAKDAGGAGRKLRQLAEEARALEKELRRGRMNAEEIRKKQDRFQTKLLEAANALEERGRDQKRRAEAFQGRSILPGDPQPVDADRSNQLRRKRAEARGLMLPPEQKRRVEWYYEDLLTR